MYGPRFTGGKIHIPSLRQLEKLARVIAADLAPIRFADWADIEPSRRMIDVLERPVGREHDAVRAEHQDRIDQRLGMKISRRSDVEIAAEIIAHPLLRRIVVPILDPAIGIVDPPHRIGQVLAEMTKNDVEPRMGIEHA